MSRAAGRSTVPSRAQQAALAKKRRLLLYLSLAMLAIIAIVAVAVASRTPKTASDAPVLAPLKVGEKAPEFAVSTTAGPFDLAQASGKPTLLEVFATWCPHCQRETAVMNALYDKFGKTVNIVAVSGSQYGGDESSPESQADVVAFGTKFDVRYPIAFDPNLDVANKYLQGGFPTIVLIGVDGNVKAIGSGEVPLANIVTALQANLAGKPVKPDFAP
jgi:thiol-disulfide isomerase/thioredoxin